MTFRSALLVTLALVICANGTTQSNVTCSDDSEWANAGNGDNPCRVAARVQGACSGNVWNVPPINSTTHYSVPGERNTPINPCTCSWAAYNLLSACTDCQGFDQSIQGWTSYSLACGTNISKTFFPPIIRLEDGTRIPFWATTNPSTWTSAEFNPATAKNIAAQGKPDFVQEVNKSHSVVGPAVGGVIGGLAGIALVVAAGFFLKIRRRRQHNRVTVQTYSDPLKHNRNFSDSSQSSGAAIGLAYARIQSPQSFATTQIQRPPISPTAHTHTSSVNSLSYFGSVNGSVMTPPQAPQAHLPSVPLPPLHNPQMNMNREEIIVPFTLRPITPSQDGVSHTSPSLADRKRPDGSIVSPMDLPSTPPPVAQIDEGPIASSSRRPKLNPPAYTPYPGQEGGPSSQTRQVHTKAGSADSQHSWDSSRSGSTTRPGGGSISAIDDVVGQMGFGAASNNNGRGGGAVTTGSMRNQPTTHPDDITSHNLA